MSQNEKSETSSPTPGGKVKFNMTKSYSWVSSPHNQVASTKKKRSAEGRGAIQYASNESTLFRFDYSATWAY